MQTTHNGGRVGAAMRWSIGAALLALLVVPMGAFALTPAELFAKVSPSVWRIRSYDKEGLPMGIGSAVVVGPGQLITNCHVLRKASRFVVAREKLSFPGTLEFWDTARDLCQVRAAIGDAPAVALADSAALTIGQNVYALGSPAGFELTLSAGLVSSLRRDAAERLTLIQTSAPISPGSSGGGLFDDSGRLVGVTTMISIERNAQNLNFALPTEWVRELPQRHAEARQRAGAQAASQAGAAPLAAPPAVAASRVPFVDEAGQARYQKYLAETAPKAFAVSDNGFFGVAVSDVSGRSPVLDAREQALQTCAAFSGRTCKLYAVDNAVVYQP